jgi:hypothetical protein
MATSRDSEAGKSLFIEVASSSSSVMTGSIRCFKRYFSSRLRSLPVGTDKANNEYHRYKPRYIKLKMRAVGGNQCVYIKGPVCLLTEVLRG